jgi:hypothetical protein
LLLPRRPRCEHEILWLQKQNKNCLLTQRKVNF